MEDVKHNLVVAQFKANHGISNKEFSNIFNCTPIEAKEWAEKGASEQVNQKVTGVHTAIKRWQQASGAFSDIDRQLYENQIEQLQRTTNTLKANHQIYIDNCESESLFEIASKRIKKRLPWLEVKHPFENIKTRGV